jgi:hypothetical protein
MNTLAILVTLSFFVPIAITVAMQVATLRPV